MTAETNKHVDLVLMGAEDAKKLALRIVEDGSVDFSPHAIQAMEDDELITQDCINLLRGGVYEPEEVKGEPRYRVCTKRMCFVVAFRSTERLRVITAWRNR